MQVKRFTVGMQLAYKLMQSVGGVETAEEAREEVEQEGKLTKR